MIDNASSWFAAGCRIRYYPKQLVNGGQIQYGIVIRQHDYEVPFDGPYCTVVLDNVVNATHGIYNDDLVAIGMCSKEELLTHPSKVVRDLVNHNGE